MNEVEKNMIVELMFIITVFLFLLVFLGVKYNIVMKPVELGAESYHHCLEAIEKGVKGNCEFTVTSKK